MLLTYKSPGPFLLSKRDEKLQIFKVIDIIPRLQVYAFKNRVSCARSNSAVIDTKTKSHRLGLWPFITSGGLTPPLCSKSSVHPVVTDCLVFIAEISCERIVFWTVSQVGRRVTTLDSQPDGKRYRYPCLTAREVGKVNMLDSHPDGKSKHLKIKSSRTQTIPMGIEGTLQRTIINYPSTAHHWLLRFTSFFLSDEWRTFHYEVLNFLYSSPSVQVCISFTFFSFIH